MNMKMLGMKTCLLLTFSVLAISAQQDPITDPREGSVSLIFNLSLTCSFSDTCFKLCIYVFLFLFCSLSITGHSSSSKGSSSKSLELEKENRSMH